MRLAEEKKLPSYRGISCVYKDKVYNSFHVLDNESFQVRAHLTYKTKDGLLVKDSAQYMNVNDAVFGFEKSNLYLKLTKDGNTDIKINYFLVSEKQSLLNFNSAKIERVVPKEYSPNFTCANGKEVKDINECPANPSNKNLIPTNTKVPTAH